MKMLSLAAIAGGIAVALVVGLTLVPQRAAAARGPLQWQAQTAEVTAGRNVRITVRLLDADSQPVAATITVTSARLDMGPDGMQGMATPLRSVANTPPGTIAFDTDLTMAGRWALRLSATVAGQTQPVSGVVVFTAAQRRTDAATDSWSRSPSSVLSIASMRARVN